MKRAFFLTLARTLALWLGFCAAAWAADVGIMPVAVHLERGKDRTTVQVVNNGREPVVMQADAIAWNRQGGVDVDAPTSDLIVNPPVFTIAPGQVQVVRVGLRRSIDAPIEGTYRMVLREVPQAGSGPAGGVSGQVRVLVALRVPVYVAPTQVVRDERWQLRDDGNGQVVAHLHNAGNVHVRVGRLRLHTTADPSRTLADQAVGAVLFPGEERSFRLAGAAVMRGVPRTLEVATDRGLQHVALDAPAGR